MQRRATARLPPVERAWKSKGSLARSLRPAHSSTPRSLKVGLYSARTQPLALSPARARTVRLRGRLACLYAHRRAVDAHWPKMIPLPDAPR